MYFVVVVSKCVCIYRYTWWGFSVHLECPFFSNEMESVIVIFINTEDFGECEFSYAELL